MDDIQEYALNGSDADSVNPVNGDEQNRRVGARVDSIHWIPAETTNTDHMTPRRYRTVTVAGINHPYFHSVRNVHPKLHNGCNKYVLKYLAKEDAPNMVTFRAHPPIQ